MLNWILIGASAPLILIGLLWRQNIISKKSSDTSGKKIKRNSIFAVALVALGGFLLQPGYFLLYSDPRKVPSLSSL